MISGLALKYQQGLRCVSLEKLKGGARFSKLFILTEPGSVLISRCSGLKAIAFRRGWQGIATRVQRLEGGRQAVGIVRKPNGTTITIAVETAPRFYAPAARPAAASRPERFHFLRFACATEAVTRNFSATTFTCQQAGQMLFGSDPAVPML